MTPDRLSDLFAERGATVTPDILSRWAELGIPTAPSARLSRRLTAETLSMVGYPTTQSTLNSLATTGEGPLFDRYGQYAIYEWGDALAWAQSKSKGKRRSSSVGRSQEAADKAKANAKHARDIRDAMRVAARAEAGASKTTRRAKRDAEAEPLPETSAKASRRHKMRRQRGQSRNKTAR
jgi:hypothetical protein